MQEKNRNTDARAEDDFMDIADAILNDLSPVIREEIWKASISRNPSTRKDQEIIVTNYTNPSVKVKTAA